MSKNKNKIPVNGKIFMPTKLNEEWLKEPARDEGLKEIYNDDYFISLIPEGCKYFAVDEKNEKIYGLGFNYIEKTEKQISDLEAKLAESEKRILELQEDSIRDNQIYNEELAKKDSEIKVGEFWHSAYKGKQLDYDKIYAELRQSYDENEKLKQQLAEKEKEISFYQNALRPKPETITELCELIRPYELKLEELSLYKDRFESLYKHHTKDKISFAVEQINNLVDMLTHRAELIKTSSRESAFVFDVHDLSICSQDLIEQLKEGK